MSQNKQIDETTVLLRPDEITLLKENAPYLIAMKVRDLRDIPAEESVESDPRLAQIPAPKQEPVKADRYIPSVPSRAAGAP